MGGSYPMSPKIPTQMRKQTTEEKGLLIDRERAWGTETGIIKEVYAERLLGKVKLSK